MKMYAVRSLGQSRLFFDIHWKQHYNGNDWRELCPYCLTQHRELAFNMQQEQGGEIVTFLLIKEGLSDVWPIPSECKRGEQSDP